MPGIVGLITKMPRERAEEQLLLMLSSILHESFYRAGTWIDPKLGVYVGWVVPEGWFADGMPVRNERGDVVLVFAGEEFPAPGTLEELKARGHRFSGSAASYLPHVYEEDSSFPARLNGRFHGLLVDRTRGTATLFNDRYGMHRIYWHQEKDGFYFGAEAKAILAARPELRRANSRGLGELVVCGCVLENRTIFADIEVLPGASAWVFQNGTLERKGSYFQPCEWEQQPTLEYEDYYQELRAVFSRNLTRYFEGDQKIGVALTGGLDTRIIMAWRKPAPGSIACYTYGGMFRESQDVIVARKVAALCKQPYQVVEVGSEFLSRFPRYAERSVYMNEGCVDLYRAPDLYVSEKAREIAPVKVVGTYGSEILRQLVMFKAVPPASDPFTRALHPQLDQARRTYTEIRVGHPITFAAFRQSPWYHFGVLAVEGSQLAVRSPYMDDDFVRTIYRQPRGATDDDRVRLRLIADGSKSLAALRTDRGIGGNAGRLRSAVQRAFLEFTFKAEYAYDYGMPQWVAKIDHFFHPLNLERLFLGRHKMFHFRVWYRDAVGEYVRQMLLDSRTLSRPYIERQGLARIINGHLKGDRNYTNEIHKVLTLELLHRLFFESPQTSHAPIKASCEKALTNVG